MSHQLYNYLEFWIQSLLTGIKYEVPFNVIYGIKGLLPIILLPFIITTTIAIIGMVFGILSYRNSKKILKMLKEKEAANK